MMRNRREVHQTEKMKTNKRTNIFLRPIDGCRFFFWPALSMRFLSFSGVFTSSLLTSNDPRGDDEIKKKWADSQWGRKAKNQDVCTGPLALSSLIRSHRSLIARSAARGKEYDSMSQNDLVLPHGGYPAIPGDSLLRLSFRIRRLVNSL